MPLVSEIPTKKFLTIEPTYTLEEALYALEATNAAFLAVTENGTKNSQFKGLVSISGLSRMFTKDIENNKLLGKKTVQYLLGSNPTPTLQPRATIIEAAKLLVTPQVNANSNRTYYAREIAICEKERLLNVVTHLDLLSFFRSEIKIGVIAKEIMQRYKPDNDFPYALAESLMIDISSFASIKDVDFPLAVISSGRHPVILGVLKKGAVYWFMNRASMLEKNQPRAIDLMSPPKRINQALENWSLAKCLDLFYEPSLPDVIYVVKTFKRMELLGRIPYRDLLSSLLLSNKSV